MDSNADNIMLMETELIVPISIDFPDDLNEEDLELLCRLCGNSSHQLMPIFSGDGAEHNLPNKIKEHLPIEVSENDSLPSSICYQCASTLISWHELYYACKDADSRLKELLEHQKDKSKEMLLDILDEDLVKNESSSDHINDFPEESELNRRPEIIVPHEINAEVTHDSVNTRHPSEEFSESETLRNSCSEVKAKDLSVIEDRSAALSSNDWSKTNANSSSTSPCPSAAAENIIASLAVDLRTSSADIDAISHVQLPFPRTCSSSRFKCFKCDRNFLDEKCLNMHYNEGRVIFANPATFHDLYKLMRSLPLVPPDKIDPRYPFVCAQCNQTFTAMNYLRSHIYCYHPSIPKFKCDFCSEKFVTECDLAEHRIVHSGSRELICVVCGCRRGTGTLPYETNKSRIAYDMCSCKNRVPPFIVDKENKKFKRRRRDEVETQKQEKITTKKAEAHLSWETTCEICGKKFPSMLSLRRHGFLHRNLVECKWCGKKFRKAYMKVHQQIHGVEKKFVCQTCGKSFAQLSSLRSHQMLEENVRKFICNVCGISFVLSSRLQSHLKTHLDDMPFKCEDCGRGYGYIWQLRQHRIRHSDVRPFACEQCGRAYKTMKHLRQHWAVHNKD